MLPHELPGQKLKTAEASAWYGVDEKPFLHALSCLVIALSERGHCLATRLSPPCQGCLNATCPTARMSADRSEVHPRGHFSRHGAGIYFTRLVKCTVMLCVRLERECAAKLARAKLGWR